MIFHKRGTVLTKPAVNTHFKQDTAAAFDSGVTEVALFTLPNGSSKDAKAAIEEALKPIDDWAKNIGKATGAADGWGESEHSLLH